MSNVPRVVIGCQDPIAEYASRGAGTLHASGLSVTMGAAATRGGCESLISGYAALANSKLQRMARQHMRRFGRVSSVKWRRAMRVMRARWTPDRNSPVWADGERVRGGGGGGVGATLRARAVSLFSAHPSHPSYLLGRRHFLRLLSPPSHPPPVSLRLDTTTDGMNLEHDD